MSKLSEFFTCKRVLSLTVLLGFMIHHMLRVNISITIVEMIVKNNFGSYGPRFNWNEEEKNNILGIFFWGYLITQVPGGRLSEKFGAKILVGTGLLISSILTILTPIVSHLGYHYLVLSRFCLGVALGIHWPSTAPIATRWIPPADRSKFMSHMTASCLGVALTLPACGYLIVYWGWPSVFYVTGGIALVWTLSWFYLVYDTPAQHPRISKNEKEKLAKKIKYLDSSVKKATPWREILSSGAVWAIIVANIVASCTFFVTFTQLPTYMSQVLKFDMQTNGWLSGLPYLVRYFASVTLSIAADEVIKTHKFSVTTIRKLSSSVLFFGTFCLFTAQAFWGYNRIVSLAVFTGSMGLMGLTTPGYHANPIDIAPAYAGTIFGISQVPGAVAGYLTTKFVALVTKERQEFEQWVYVFWMLAVVNLFGAIFCLVLASGEEQKWSLRSEEEEMEKLGGGESPRLTI